MTTSAPNLPTGRLAVLDVLRGVALLGMFLVHFSMYASDGGAMDRLYQRAVALLMEERFWALFAMLFGAGFAIQARRAEQRGGSFVPTYLRRLTALAGFGFFTHAVFGFNVLLSYAVWGLPLLVMRRWSVRALFVALILSAISFNIYSIGGAAYGVATRGEQSYREARQAKVQENRAFNETNRAERESSSYPTVFAAQLRHMRWFYAQPFSFLPANTFAMILLGVLAVRLGLFDAPERHRRMIAGLMGFGAISWAVSLWVYSLPPAGPDGPFLRNLIAQRSLSGFGLIRPTWLAFTYMGLVLLLVARNRAWLGRLAVFGWTGRMALTNYVVQIAVLELLFANYALGVSVTPLVGLLLALALFLGDAWLSRWWLARFRYGPLEWLWRSITYARWQSWREPQPIVSTAPGFTSG